MYRLSDLVVSVKVLERGFTGAEPNAPAQSYFQSMVFGLHFDTMVAAMPAWERDELRGGG